MQVFNNAPAFTVWKTYTNSVDNMRQSMSKLSSGLRIITAADDPAGLATSERMRAQYRNSAQAARNVTNMISYIQTGDSWLQAMQDIMGRMAELAIAANDETKSDTDRDNLQAEFAQLQSEVQRITSGSSAAAKYNGLELFQGGEVTLQIGPDTGQVFSAASLDLAYSTATALSTGVQWSNLWNSSFSIGVASNAGTAVNKLNLGIDYISEQRAILGAEQAREGHTLTALRNYEDNIRAAESRIRDVDVARETTNFTKYQVLTQIGTAMLAQANALPQGMLQLLG